MFDLYFCANAVLVVKAIAVPVREPDPVTPVGCFFNGCIALLFIAIHFR